MFEIPKCATYNMYASERLNFGRGLTATMNSFGDRDNPGVLNNLTMTINSIRSGYWLNNDCMHLQKSIHTSLTISNMVIAQSSAASIRACTAH